MRHYSVRGKVRVAERVRDGDDGTEVILVTLEVNSSGEADAVLDMAADEREFLMVTDEED